MKGRRIAHHALVLCVTMGTAACAAVSTHELSREQMLPIVRKATWPFCHQPERWIVDCRLSLMFVDGVWSVIASPVFRPPDGKPTCCEVDQDAIFDFSPDGKLIRTIHAD